MDRIREFLSRRVFGVPVVAFVLIASAVLLYFALRMKKTEPTVDEDASTDEPTGDADPFGGDQGNPIFQASPTQSTVIAQPAQDTNEMWGARARTWLIGQGNDPLVAQALVYKYLNSQTLTAAESKLISQVISSLGYPPDPPDLPDPLQPETPLPPDPTGEPVTPVQPGGPAGNNTPPTKQGEPPTVHTVVNARDNGPGELGRLYFGSNAPTVVNKIEAANVERGIGDGPWPVGTKVKIPANVDPAYFTTTQNVRGLNEIAAKNGVSKEYIKTLNPGMDFPRPVGTKVRIR